jgi:hypothetical protein
MDFQLTQKEVRQKMKKMISFALVVLLATASYSIAEESVQNEEKSSLDPTPAVGVMTETEVSEALEALEGLEDQETQEIQKTVEVLKVSNAQETSETLDAPKAKQVRKAQRTEKARPNTAEQKPVAVTRAQARRATRQEIRSMDILDRPNRPGHFYGNTVRRLHGR